MSSMATAKTASSRALRRQSTENALLDAFESVLLEQGIRNLSLNAIVDRAGVGKPLLYRYFRDLSGLVNTWAERRGFWRGTNTSAVPSSTRAASDREFREQVAAELVDNAERLRANPVTLEFLAEELTANSDLSTAFAETREARRRTFLRAMFTDSRYTQRENRRLIIILNAALTYLAMRSRRSPEFMGLRLDTDEGWQEAMDMAREIAGLEE